MKTRRIFFLTILVLALVLRFYQLGGVPPSLNWDEAGMGYNAYSLIKTGGFDEYGEFLPLSFRSFDDYKPPFYTYLTRIPVLLLGLNDFAIRFVSAIMGVLTVIFTYFLVLELFNNWKIALLSMFFLSVSPWHLQFSRVAFEANVAVFFLVAGVWAFLKWVRQNGQWLAISAIFYRPEPLEESIKRIAEDEEMGQKFIGELFTIEDWLTLGLLLKITFPILGPNFYFLKPIQLLTIDYLDNKRSIKIVDG